MSLVTEIIYFPIVEDIKNATPVEIDTALCEIESTLSEYARRAMALRDRVDDTFNPDAIAYRRSRYLRPLRRTEIFKAIAEYWKIQAEVEPGRAHAAELRAEFQRRPWTRFFHVTNTNGHIHQSTCCSTCFPTTVYGWRTELSGSTEEEMVKVWGETACTVCFPSAPTFKGFGDGTSYMAKLTEAEKAAKRDAKQAARDAKAAKKAAHKLKEQRWATIDLIADFALYRGHADTAETAEKARVEAAERFYKTPLAEGESILDRQEEFIKKGNAKARKTYRECRTHTHLQKYWNDAIKSETPPAKITADDLFAR